MHTLSILSHITVQTTRSYLAGFKNLILHWSVTGGFLWLILNLCTWIWGAYLPPSELQIWIWKLILNETLILSIPSFSAQMEEEIHQRPLFTFLIQPIDYAFLKLAKAYGESLVGWCVIGSLGSLMAFQLVGAYPGSLVRFIAYLPIFLCVLALHVCIITMIGLSVVWFKRSFLILMFYKHIIFFGGGLLIPIESYPEHLQKILYLTPFPYLLSLQSSTIMGTQTLPLMKTLIGTAIWATIIIGLFVRLNKQFKKACLN